MNSLKHQLQDFSDYIFKVVSSVTFYLSFASSLLIQTNVMWILILTYFRNTTRYPNFVATLSNTNPMWRVSFFRCIWFGFPMYNINYKEKRCKILLWLCEPVCDILYSNSKWTNLNCFCDDCWCLLCLVVLYSGRNGGGGNLAVSLLWSYC